MNNKDASEMVQYLADRAAIQEVLAAYFRGLDRCDRELVRSCFTEDVHVHYDKRAPVSGIDAVMAQLRTSARMEKGEMKVTTHFMGNLNVKYIRGPAADWNQKSSFQQAPLAFKVLIFSSVYPSSARI